MTDSKKCTKCGETKPLDEFHRWSKGRDGRNPRCKDCRSIRNQPNAEEVRQRDRARYYADRETKLAAVRDYRNRNLDRMRAYDRARHESRREHFRMYRAENPHIWWAHGYVVRARRFGFDPIVEDFTKADVIGRYGDSCAYCDTGAFEHLDHAIPVSKGGPHTLDNVRPSCAGCNLAKTDKTEAEWLAEQAALDDLTEDELEAAIDEEIDRWTQPKESK